MISNRFIFVRIFSSTIFRSYNRICYKVNIDLVLSSVFFSFSLLREFNKIKTLKQNLQDENCDVPPGLMDSNDEMMKQVNMMCSQGNSSI